MSSQATPAQIKQHIEVIDAALAAKKDILPKLTNDAWELKVRETLEKEIRQLERGVAYWTSEYRKKTGGQSPGARAQTFTKMEHDMALAQKQKREAAARAQKARQHVTSETLKAQNGIQLLRDRLQSSRKHAADHWVRAFLVHQAGGVSFMNTFLVEKKIVPKAEAALTRARELTAQGKLGEAEVHLVEAARWMNAGYRALHEYEEALGVGAQRVEITIKVSTAIAGGGITSGVSGAQAVAVEMVGAGAGEATTLAAEAASGGKIGDKEVTDAVVNTLIAGGAAAAGEFGKSMLAKPVADLLYGGKPNAAQIEAVGEAVKSYYSANGKQLLEAVKQIRAGKKPTYDWWAGVLAPTLSNVAPKLDTPAKIWSEKDVRDQLMAAKTSR